MKPTFYLSLLLLALSFNAFGQLERQQLQVYKDSVQYYKELIKVRDQYYQKHIEEISETFRLNRGNPEAMDRSMMIKQIQGLEPESLRGNGNAVESELAR